MSALNTIPLGTNICRKTDAYKLGHHAFYLANEKIFSYFEARKGAKYPYTLFFGLQMILPTLAGVQVTQEKIDAAEKVSLRRFGANSRFNRKGWEHILNNCGGKLPAEICAVAEGTKVPVDNALMTTVNTDKKSAWLVGHLETLLTHVWYPCTVATNSASVKDLMNKKLIESGADLGGLEYMLHDFGGRGVTGDQAAGRGGAAHLVNFNGSDTEEGAEYMEHFYGTDPAVSIPATEHSVATQGGREGEEGIVKKVLDEHPEGIVAMVGDSYDYYNFVENIIGGTFRERIAARPGKVVVRPDSVDGDKTPGIIMRWTLDTLWEKFGGTVNDKGFRVLNPCVGVIWGDGIRQPGIEEVFEKAMASADGIKYSAECVVFGMGGGLLQDINRDTQRFAFKACARFIDGEWIDVFKCPIDQSKASKKGRMKLIKVDGVFKTVPLEAEGENLLVPVFLNGDIVKTYTLEEVRANAAVEPVL